MINEGFADLIHQEFGFRKPSPEEKRRFQATLNQFKQGGAQSASRADDMAIYTSLIETRLTEKFQALHNQDLSPKYISAQTGVNEKLPDFFKNLKSDLSDLLEDCYGSNQTLNHMLDKIATGLRTAVMIVALVLKTIVGRLNKAGQLTKENFDKFFESGLSFTQELASLQQFMLHSVTNYLCGNVVNFSMSSDTMLQTSFRFSDKRFEMNKETGELGTKDNFISNLAKPFKKLVRNDSGFKNDYEKSKLLPVFKCPAKYARVDLDIEGENRSVDFIEAIYRIATRMVSKNLFTS